jgi:hypothetical protein
MLATPFAVRVGWFPLSDHSGRLFQFHIEQAQLFASDKFGARMIAPRTGRFPASALEIVAAILAMMPNRQHLDEQLCALGHRAASGFRKSCLQAVGIEYPASTNGKMKSKNSTDGVSVRSLIDHGQNTIDYFAFVHAPPRGRKNYNGGLP